MPSPSTNREAIETTVIAAMALTHTDTPAADAAPDQIGNLPSSPSSLERRETTQPSGTKVALRHPPRRTNTQELLITIGALVVAGLLAIAGTIVWLDGVASDIVNPDLNTALAPSSNQTNWLIVGSDSRDGIDPDAEGSAIFVGEEVIGRRTDTIMLARLDTDSGTVDLMSLPRDLWVPIDGTARDGRINSAFNGEGGQQRLIDTVEGVFDIEIHHYAEINFVGFQQAIDAMGGIPIWFDRALRDPAADLNIAIPGCHVLDGYEALAFSRSRNLEFYDGQAWRADGSGDLGRSTRQRFLIQRMVDHATASLNVTDFDTVARLIGAAGSNLTVDAGITPDRLVELARVFQDLDGDAITTHILPTVPFRTPGGSAVLALQPAEANPVLSIYRGVEPEPIVPEEAAVRLSIFNGSRTPGQAGEVESALGAEGFEIDLVDNGPTTKETLIVYGPGMETGAERIARYLETPPTFVPDPAAKGISLTTGTDYTGIRITPLEADAVLAPEVPVPADAGPTAGALATPSVEIGIVPGSPPPGTDCS